MSAPRLPFGKAPSLSSSLTDALVRELQGRGWMTARALAHQLLTDDRTIREAAHQSHGRVISGQKGYCLLSEATTAEALHAASWLKHQGELMIKRAAQIHAAMHVQQEQAS